MAIAPQRSKGVRWLYIIIALVVVLGLAYWLRTAVRTLREG